MNTNQILGLRKILRHHPHVLSIVTPNLYHRLTHPITKKSSKGWSAPPETDLCGRHRYLQPALQDVPVRFFR